VCFVRLVELFLYLFSLFTVLKRYSLLHADKLDLVSNVNNNYN
jgi:hypothetical protein